MNGASATADAAAFRLRGTDVTRLESLSDVVFGFALTLLVVSLQVPQTYGQLIQAMRGFPAFAVCFWLLVMLWRSHHRFFRRYGLHDDRTIVLNCVLMFLIVFYIYPLKFLFFELLGGAGPVRLPNGTIVPAAEWQTHIEAIMIIFSLGFAAVYVLYALMYAHAYSRRASLALSSVEAFDTLISLADYVSLVAIGVIAAIAAALLGPARAGTSGFAFLLIQPALFLLHRITRRRRMELIARGEAVTAG